MPKRALILAGGGLKVGFQAGVLEVWLDEAGLIFDHADGASGGCFNLAMYCQGLSGRQIADNWRTLDPFLPIDLNWEHYWKFLHAPSLFTYDSFRQRVLPAWGIDWARIRAGRLGTFNAYNFSRKRLDTFTNDQMTEDHLIAAVSLPMWFPPVRVGGDTYIDAVYISDAHVEEAIRRGADEIWAIWTVSTQPEWRDGFVAQYFHIIETCADTHFFTMLGRIDESNRQLAAGQRAEFGRPITVRLLQAEVPVHYLFNLSRDRMAEAVNLGVKAARDWCRQNGVPLPHPGRDYVPVSGTRATSLRFTEEMKGFVALGATDSDAGYARGKSEHTTLSVTLTVHIDDADRFMVDPDHAARIVGTVSSPVIGGDAAVDEGTFNLLVHDADPSRKEMRYRIVFRQPGSVEPRTLVGVKHVQDDPGADAWADTTTLFVTIHRGALSPGQEDASALLGSGIIRIEPLDFLRQLTTFRADGPSVSDRLSAVNRFGLLFFGKLWDVYGRQFVAPAPL